MVFPSVDGAAASLAPVFADYAEVSASVGIADGAVLVGSQESPAVNAGHFAV